MSEADSRRGDNGDSGTDARDRLLDVLNRAKLNPTQADPATRRPTFFLVRHAESTGNLQACLQGSRIGGSLSERGRKQSTATAMYLFNAFEELRQGNVRLVSSPSTRALETATPIAEKLNCEIQLDRGLAELDFGDWSGTPVALLEGDRGYQLWKADPWFNAPPDGESLFQVRTRVFRAMSQLIAGAAEGDPLVMVTHFFPLMVLFEILAPGKEVRCDNGSISRFELQDRGWTTTGINQVSHLAEVAPVPVRYV